MRLWYGEDTYDASEQDVVCRQERAGLWISSPLDLHRETLTTHAEDHKQVHDNILARAMHVVPRHEAEAQAETLAVRANDQA